MTKACARERIFFQGDWIGRIVDVVVKKCGQFGFPEILNAFSPKEPASFHLSSCQPTNFYFSTVIPLCFIALRRCQRTPDGPKNAFYYDLF